MVFKSNTRVRTRTDYIVVHCSATGANQDIGAAEIDKWHRAKGWQCIGYHYVIRRDGTVEEGRARDVIGAHVEGWNEFSVGVCMVGGVDANDITKAVNNFTPEQFESLNTLLTELKQAYPNATIQGHRDFPKVSKACPSFDVKGWLEKVGIK
ncbi:MAG: lysozyme [Polynucleobacter sp. 39-45-136]|nr:MAG: lysozyme [Polynucleobacter sp. 39-45-136]